MNEIILENLDGKDWKWEDVISYVVPLATHVEFNILYSDSVLEKILKKYRDSIEDTISKKKKIYRSGKVLRLKLTEEVKDFIACKAFSDFKNWVLEDPSFYINDIEIIASVSHEDQIHLRSTHINMEYFQHFDLAYCWSEEKDGLLKKLLDKFK